MRLLLDTNILIWSLTETEKLPRRARSAIEDDDNERLFSAVCIGEIAIKTVLGKVGFTLDPGNVIALAIDAGFRELPITSSSPPSASRRYLSTTETRSTGSSSRRRSTRMPCS